MQTEGRKKSSLITDACHRRPSADVRLNVELHVPVRSGVMHIARAVPGDECRRRALVADEVEMGARSSSVGFNAFIEMALTGYTEACVTGALYSTAVAGWVLQPLFISSRLTNRWLLPAVVC